MRRRLLILAALAALLLGGALAGAPTLTTAISRYLPTATSCAQSADGELCWDSDDNQLQIGTGAGRLTFLDTTSAAGSYQPAAANLDAVSASATSGDVLAAPGGMVAWSSLAEAGIQPADADLTTYAGITPSAAVQSILDDASIPAIQTTLGDGIGRTPIVHTAAGAPTVNDDSSAKYQVGDLWSDTSGLTTYIADSVGVGTASWRALLSPNAILIYLSGGVWYARPQVVDLATGSTTAVGAAVAMTAEGTSYSESLSGTSITVTGPAVGNTGAIQSNSRRWAVALSALGITLTNTNRRYTYWQGQFASMTDNGEARVGTIELGWYLGTGSTTAASATCFYRPSTGTGTYGVGWWAGADTALATIGTGSSVKGAVSRHAWPTSTSRVDTNSLTASGTYLNALGGSAAAISGSAPTTLVAYLRSTAGASGAVWNNPRMLLMFGPEIASF